MKTQFKSIILLFLFPALLFANNSKPEFKHTKDKSYHKEYNVNSDAILNISNSYGNVDIVSWNENRIVIDIKITVKGSSEEKVQKRLDGIDVEFSASNSSVTAKTTFKKKSSWSWFGSNNNSSMKINYTIKMPVTNSLDLNNDYGAINLNKLDGKATINCDYGQLIIGELNANDNSLNFDYTTNSTIEYMNSGKINADYSGFTLDKTETLVLNADYTNSSIGEVNEIEYNCDYGKVIIDTVTNLNGQGDYINHLIGSVGGNVSILADYGSIKIEHITSSAKDVNIQADYTGIKLGYDSNYNFDFTINLQYSSLKGENDLTVKNTSKNNSSEKYSGYHGTEGTGNLLTINSDYGGVTLNRN